VLFVYQLKTAEPTLVKPLGLDPQRQYRVQEINLPTGAKSQLARDGATTSGAALMRDGIVPPCSQELESSVIEIVAEAAK
jgi:alpha-galactosidase